MHLKSGLWVLGVISVLLIMLLVQIQLATSDDNNNNNNNQTTSSITETRNEIDKRDLHIVDSSPDPTYGDFYQSYTYNFNLNINPEKVSNISSLGVRIIGYPPNGENFEIFNKKKTYTDIQSKQQITFDINPRNEIKKGPIGNNYQVFLGEIIVDLFISINGKAPIPFLTKIVVGPDITFNIKYHNEGEDPSYFCIEAVASKQYKFHPYIEAEGKNNTYEWKIYPKDCTSRTTTGNPGTLKWIARKEDKGKSFVSEWEVIER